MKERRLRRYFTLFSLFFLLFAFTGCDTQQETVSETSQQPTQETVLEMDWKNNKQTIPNLRVIAEDQQWILLEQDSESPEINYRFLVYVTDGIWTGAWKDQNGEIADPGQFAVNVECTLVMREGKQLQQPAVYRPDNQTVRYLYLLDTNTLDGLYLDGQTNQESVQPFFGYREQVVSGEMLVDGRNLTYQPLTQQQLDKTISLLEDITCFPNESATDGSNLLGTEGSLRLTFSDGSQLLLTVLSTDVGEYQIGCKTDSGNQYYWVRSPYLGALREWMTTLSNQIKGE